MNKKTTNIRKIMLLIFIMIFVIGTLYIGYYTYNHYKAKQDNKNVLNDVVIVQEEIIKEKTERMIQIEKLKEENPDIIGWIEIEGTNINYPVFQTTDNNYYLNHNNKKEKSLNGAIFLDKDSDLNKPTSNFLIYGHNNKNEPSFRDLMKYKKEEFYKEHQTIKFTTLEEDVKYEIISVFLSKVYYKNEKNVFKYYFFINAEDENEYNYYINESKKASIYDTHKTAEYGEQLLTLSTCEYSKKDGRFVIVARKVI